MDVCAEKGIQTIVKCRDEFYAIPIFFSLIV